MWCKLKRLDLNTFNLIYILFFTSKNIMISFFKHLATRQPLCDMVNLLIRFLTLWRRMQTAYDLVLGNVHILKLILRLSWFSFNILPLNTSWWIMQRKVIFAASFFIRFPHSTILGTSPCRRTICHSTHKFVKWDFILCNYFLQFTESVFNSSSSTMHWNRYCVDLVLFTECF
jgi:hypothetical protein